MNEVTNIIPVDVEPVAPPVANTMISMIERVMLNPDADMDKLDRLLEMQERFEAKNARIAFSGAIAAARAKIPPIVKDATVNFKTKSGCTQYKHETLAGIAKTIDPILSEHGISYRFRTEQDHGGVRVTCIISHSDGHFEETSLSGNPDTSGSKNGFQAVGSAVTYLQRYTLKAAMGLSAEVDDDAQGAGQRPDQRQKSNSHQKESRKSDDEVMAENMIASIREHGAASVEADEKFRLAFSRLQTTSQQESARVQVEIDNWHQANKPPASALVDDDEIPY